MSEDKKPIFPRSTESSEEEKQDLRRQTAAKLESVENTFDHPFSKSQKARYCSRCQSKNPFEDFFCRECGHKLNILEAMPPVPVYGPPVMKLDNVQPDFPILKDFKVNKDMYPYRDGKIPAPAYGPPPLNILGNNKILWLAIGVVVILVILSIFLIR